MAKQQQDPGQNLKKNNALLIKRNPAALPRPHANLPLGAAACTNIRQQTGELGEIS